MHQTMRKINYNILLEFFDGPLDLLLHLVQQREVSVEEVPMAEIASQYLEIVSEAANERTADSEDFDRLTEYLVVAATLLSIKSESLLPRAGDLLDDPELETRDPALYEALRERIRIYEITKKRATALRARPQLGLDTFVRRNLEEPVNDMGFENESSLSLTQSFVALLSRIGERGRKYFVRSESISIVDSMMKILSVFERVSPGVSLGFFQLVRRFRTSPGSSASSGSEDPRAEDTRATVVGTLLAVLELCRRGVISAQVSGDGQIVLASASNFSKADANNIVRLDDYREQANTSDMSLEVANSGE